MLNESTKSALKTLAFVNDLDLNIYENNHGKKSLTFDFKNSLKANQCHIVEYVYRNKDMFVVQFKKDDKLVYESVIKPQEFEKVFENITGIYLSYLQ